jgi:hypothetical protein
MVFHRHLHAAVVDRGLRDIHTSCRRLHRLNRGPNEEGKASQDNEQTPEDQDTHACNIPRSLPPFKVLSMAGLCAKHIVASGIDRVVYLEPYPRSYASALHGDSIEVEGGTGTNKKVSFDPFKGVSPHRYRDLFEKGRRKFSGGAAQQWNQGKRRPMIEVYYPSYFQAEISVVGRLEEDIEAMISELNTQESTSI